MTRKYPAAYSRQRRNARKQRVRLEQNEASIVNKRPSSFVIVAETFLGPEYGTYLKRAAIATTLLAATTFYLAPGLNLTGVYYDLKDLFQSEQVELHDTLPGLERECFITNHPEPEYYFENYDPSLRERINTGVHNLLYVKN